MKLWFPAIIFLSTSYASAQPTVKEILLKIDAVQNHPATKVESEMVVHTKRFERRIKSLSYVEGKEKAFTEYLAPKREKGTKMLKLGDKIWIYYPQADRTVTIAGHMLRQSVMGSDLSYEDMMENDSLADAYSGTLTRSDTILKRNVWELELKANSASSAYQKRKVWVDQERFVVLKELLYSATDILLKSVTIKKVEQFGKRWYPTQIIFKDELKQGKGTEYLIHNIEFLESIPSSQFEKRQLRR
ncbi:outer membrane lipoprotein-sorting protein [Pseudobacteriovorax antillogorgiicola]|uniref:Outer membrane lipoprotein-sorting protein n=1 Tax=Pseudobacteriovorax antillogorgiicola TaxID=1513793 RepID=A0A1Y6CE48_9BACT|nr:outer membrane lipoprotein-sorting protein [Pseudobacteriovorax antillogorgiicola]TCS48318.1 MucB/RseB-like sigma(E) regulatory protein [Pseudobacteriovorax antillogorgiicola]SMF56624.1 outer membrane lipoprotein-sorting protein [Pseudobacteriovorax antillogorgiicola]